MLTAEGTDSVSFVNKEPVLNKQIILENLDQVGVVDSSLTVFIYFDPYSKSQDKYPRELRDEFVILNTLGKGGFGEVNLAMTHHDCTRRAVKRLDLVKYGDDKKFLWREINTLKKLSHNCIIRMYDVVECDDYTYIIMEYARGGELPRKRLSEMVWLL